MPSASDSNAWTAPAESGQVGLERSSADLVAEVRLSMVRGIGPRLRSLLLSAFETPGQVLGAAASDLQRVDGIGKTLATRIADAHQQIDAEAEIRLAHENGIRILTLQSPDYPRLLKEVHDPPGVLYCRGNLLPADQMAVAIVGTRHATRYGLAQAERLSTELARRGVTVVSGLARGIDGAAHRAAIAAGGRTYAVLGSGILRLYPPEHLRLADEVSANGCLMSEMPPRMPPLSGSFPQRNRVISGLTLGTLVIEAADRSGALITARHAGEQGREVFALPGPADSRLSRGCHRLIKDGAKLVETVDDIMEELGPLVESYPTASGETVRNPAELGLNEIEQQVLQAVETSQTAIDTVVQKTELPVHRVLSTISILEMRGLIRRTGGTFVVRV